MSERHDPERFYHCDCVDNGANHDDRFYHCTCIEEGYTPLCEDCALVRAWLARNRGSLDNELSMSLESIVGVCK